MYIPYEAIGSLPILNKFKNTFYNLKIKQNLKYIAKNIKAVTKRLQKKAKKQKLNIVFYVYDESKWKCQSLYDLFIKDKYFNVKILVTKNAATGDKNPSLQTSDDVKKTYYYFKNKGMNVEYAYDIKNEKFIPFKNFNPDIIIYQHPWYVETSQGPVVCSKFALTYYVPYYVGNTTEKLEYDLRFHSYVHKYYILDEIVKKHFSISMQNKGKNLEVVGNPTLDFYICNKKLDEKKYIIYAPHWSINYDKLHLSTFEWNGKFILNYAKAHKEMNWIFKPHPLLKRRLLTENIMTEDEIKKYWQEWKSLGKICEDGNYMNYFNEAKALVTDSGSFLTEFFLTEQPVIHLLSDISENCWTPDIKEIIDTYYKVSNIEELKLIFTKVLEKNSDTLKDNRIKILKKLDLINKNSAKLISNNIKKELQI